jgi:hypothetical protein
LGVSARLDFLDRVVKELLVLVNSPTSAPTTDDASTTHVTATKAGRGLTATQLAVPELMDRLDVTITQHEVNA